MAREIRYTFTYKHPPEVVWNYLTQPDLLAQWLMPNDIKPEAGHRFMFKTKPMEKFGFDGNVYCEVLEVVPFQKLVCSWKGGMSKENPTLDSIVEWTLNSVPGGTELHLLHTGFKGVNNFMAYIAMNIGWGKIGKRLGSLLNTAVHGTA
jgi:uncharacterized protein YndB with AHSA1/START domain